MSGHRVELEAPPSAGPLAPEGLADANQQQRLASDPNVALPVRLEAFEDIIESTVGDTTLSRARNVERDTGLRQLYFKFEGGNPTGTQKDRIAYAQAMDALRRGYDALVLATCGNYGVAAATACAAAGLGCRVFIPHTYHSRRVEAMIGLGARVVTVEGDYECAVERSRECAAAEDLYDANPGSSNTGLQLHAYGEIAYEIYDELRDAPAAVAVPVSNGTTLAGLYRGFVSLYRRGKTSRIPRIVAGSSHGKNPIVNSWLRNDSACRDLPPESIRETAVNEPLINWHSIDGDAALSAIRQSQGWAGQASDKMMRALARQVGKLEGLRVLPASTAGLVALLEAHRVEPLTADRYVAVLTGRDA